LKLTDAKSLSAGIIQAEQHFVPRWGAVSSHNEKQEAAKNHIMDVNVADLVVNILDTAAFISAAQGLIGQQRMARSFLRVYDTFAFLHHAPVHIQPFSVFWILNLLLLLILLGLGWIFNRDFNGFYWVVITVMFATSLLVILCRSLINLLGFDRGMLALGALFFFSARAIAIAKSLGVV
jgi:hypothetical protein